MALHRKEARGRGPRVAGQIKQISTLGAACPLYYPAGAVGCSNGDIGSDGNNFGVFVNGREIWRWYGDQLAAVYASQRFCYDPKMTRDGRWVAFVLVDERGLGQIMVSDLYNKQQHYQLTHTTTGSNRFPWVDYDAAGDLWVGWISNAVDLTPTKYTNQESAIICRFRDGYLRVASWGASGIWNGNVVTQMIVQDRTVMDSDATNAGFDNHGLRQVYVHDHNTGATLLVSRNDHGTVITTGENIQPRSSQDRTRIAWQSRAKEIVTPDNAARGNGEIFCSDLNTGILIHCSPFVGESADCHISPNGRYVAFETNAPNVPGYEGEQQEGTMSSFVLDLNTGLYTKLNEPVPEGGTQVYAGGHPRVANNGSAVYNRNVDGIWKAMSWTPEEAVA